MTSSRRRRWCGDRALRSLRAFLVLPAMALAPAIARPTAIGAEFQVNAYTPSAQAHAAVAVAANGAFVVVWDSVGVTAQDGSSNGVFGRRFSSSGAAFGGEFQVNSFTSLTQAYPA